MVDHFRQFRNFINRTRFVFLFIVIIFFNIAKCVSHSDYLSYLTLIVYFVTVIYSLYVIGRDNRYLWFLTFIFGVSSIIASIATFIFTDMYFFYLHSVLVISFYFLMFYACIFYTLQDKVITVTTLFGSLCAYLFLGFFFASIYQLIFKINIMSFDGITTGYDELIYFSFVTLTTLGYGDIRPVSELAKTLSWIEAYLGQAYLTILIALLVGKYLKEK